MQYQCLKTGYFELLTGIDLHPSDKNKDNNTDYQNSGYSRYYNFLRQPHHLQAPLLHYEINPFDREYNSSKV